MMPTEDQRRRFFDLPRVRTQYRAHIEVLRDRFREKGCSGFAPMGTDSELKPLGPDDVDWLFRVLDRVFKRLDHVAITQPDMARLTAVTRTEELYRDLDELTGTITVGNEGMMKAKMFRKKWGMS